MGLGAWKHPAKALLNLEVWGVPAILGVPVTTSEQDFPSLAHTTAMHAALQTEDREGRSLPRSTRNIYIPRTTPNTLPWRPGHREGTPRSWRPAHLPACRLPLLPPVTLEQISKRALSLPDTAVFWKSPAADIPTCCDNGTGWPYTNLHGDPSCKMPGASYLLHEQLQGHRAGHRIRWEGLRPARGRAIPVHGPWEASRGWEQTSGHSSCLSQGGMGSCEPWSDPGRLHRQPL